MKYAVNNSAPLPLTVAPEQYLYGENDYVPIVDNWNENMSISDVMKVFSHPELKVRTVGGRELDYIPSRRIVVPVNKENVIKYGILDKKYEAEIPDSIVLRISDKKDYLSKGELFLLDLLNNYQWDRPLCLLSMGGDLNIGIKEYFEYRGYSYMFVPIKNSTSQSKPGFTDPDELYSLLTDTYKFDAVSADNYLIDYQNMYTHIGVMSLRNMFKNSAEVFMEQNDTAKAVELLDKGVEVMKHYPLETVCLGFSGNDYTIVLMVEDYFKLGCPEKAIALEQQLEKELMKTLRFFLPFYKYASDEVDLTAKYLYLLSDIMKENGQSEASERIENAMLSTIGSK